MAKSPVMGRVKRRLAGEIGAAAALRFYRKSFVHCVQRLGYQARWRTAIAVTPDRDLGARFWPRGLPCLPQGEGDLGKRMQRLFRRMPPGPVIVVGSDIPAIRPSHVAEAFKRLGGADVVIGPAADGGFWLIGFKRVPGTPSPFAGVRWSGPYALADTLANLKAKRVAFVAALHDVDTGADLKRERSAERLITGDVMRR